MNGYMKDHSIVAKLCIYFVITASITQYGCTPRYIQPEDENAAFVRLRLGSVRVFSILHTYEHEGCVGPQAIGLLGGDSSFTRPAGPDRVIPTMLGSTGKPEWHSLEIRAQANKLFTVRYHQYGPHHPPTLSTCTLPLTFFLEPKGNYEVIFDYEQMPKARCYAQIYQLSAGPQQEIRREPVKNAFKETGSCKGTYLE